MSAVTSSYRPDVDGLRAVAVIAVLLFHGFPGAFPGGFVGVDVFFVISGYLITGILLAEIDQDRFSVLRFYVRRARRLFPALFVVLLAALVFGWLALLPSEFRALGKHVFGGSIFVSNILLWREVGYFDVVSEHKPMLHLWSLGVEEQYYLLWPLLLFALARTRRALWIVAGSLAVVTFAANVLLVDRWPSLVFYLPVTRLWELMAGGLLAFWLRQASQAGTSDPAFQAGPPVAAPRWLPHALSIAGAMLIVVASVALTRHTAFPGWAALLPASGAMLVIAAGPTALVNRHLLSAAPAVWIGLISYPLYLWHWPLLSYARIVLDRELSPLLASALIGLAVALAWATYRFVESPFRAPARGAPAWRDAVMLWTLILLLGVAGVAAWRTTWLTPQSSRFLAVQRLDEAQADWVDVADDVIPGARPERVLFIGDSHMQQYLPRIERIARDRAAPTLTVEFRTAAGCAPMGGIERRSIACRRFVDEAFAAARDASVKTVVFAASWYGFSIRDDYYRADDPRRVPLKPFAHENRWILERWATDLRQLQQTGKRVVVVASSPRGPLVSPLRLVERTDLRWDADAPPRADRQALYGVVEAVDARILEAARQAGVEILQPFDWLCDAAACATLDPAGRPIYYDETHLRASFVRDRLAMLDRYVYVAGEAPREESRLSAAQAPLKSGRSHE